MSTLSGLLRAALIRLSSCQHLRKMKRTKHSWRAKVSTPSIITVLLTVDRGEKPEILTRVCAHCAKHTKYTHKKNWTHVVSSPSGRIWSAFGNQDVFEINHAADHTKTPSSVLQAWLQWCYELINLTVGNVSTQPSQKSQQLEEHGTKVCAFSLYSLVCKVNVAVPVVESCCVDSRWVTSGPDHPSVRFWFSRTAIAAQSPPPVQMCLYWSWETKE